MANADLQVLLDEREIRRVLERYCRGVDRLDEALLASCYHDDATDDHGMFKGSGIEFAAFCVKVLRLHAVATQHVLAQSIIGVDGDSAACETYVLAHHRCEREGATVLESFGGRYVDRMERRAGEWKIADRVVVVEWEKAEKVEPAFPPGLFVEGRRDGKDLAQRQVSESARQN
jgi:hypothetical protein